MGFFFSQNKTSVNYTATHLFSVVYHMSALICVLDLRINVWWSEIHLWEFHCHIIVLWLYNFAAIQKKTKTSFSTSTSLPDYNELWAGGLLCPLPEIWQKTHSQEESDTGLPPEAWKVLAAQDTGASTKQTSSLCQLQVITNRRRLICRQRLISCTPVLRCLSFQTSARHFHYRTKRRHLYHANKWWRTQRR